MRRRIRCTVWGHWQTSWTINSKRSVTGKFTCSSTHAFVPSLVRNGKGKSHSKYRPKRCVVNHNAICRLVVIHFTSNFMYRISSSFIYAGCRPGTTLTGTPCCFFGLDRFYGQYRYRIQQSIASYCMQMMQFYGQPR